MRGSGVRIALVVVDVFVALTAVGGGSPLAAGLEANRFPLDWLRETPFRSYVILGLILAGVVGAAQPSLLWLRSAARTPAGWFPSWQGWP